MFGWLRRVFDSGVGRIESTVLHWVTDLVTGVYSFLHTIFHDTGVAWNYLTDNAKLAWRELKSLAHEVVHGLYWIVKVLIPDLAKWAGNEFKRIEHYILSVYHTVLRLIDNAVKYAEYLVKAAEHWVITDIWDPIWRTLSQAWHWVTHEGDTLWHYLTHIGEFVDLFWDALLIKIEREAWNAGKLLGRFFISLIVHHVRMFATLIEDIVDAIL